MQSLPRLPVATLWTLGILLAALGLVTSGCGPSQHDLMMRAAQRPRPADDAEADDAEADDAEADDARTDDTQTGGRQSRRTQAEIASNGPTSNSVPRAAHPASPAAAGAATAASSGAVEEASVDGTEPIDSRRPELPLSELERRQRSAENLRRIGAALASYVEQKGRLPLPAMTAANGSATLSWRVELLPYLGYDALYRRFDPNQPWDGPKNLPLLELIPDCYASPERFDTATNYLGVAGKTYLFNGKPVSLRKAEDGLENTLAIVEVNDSHAVPWTSPVDYTSETGQLKVGLGGLRPEGIYALWGNGWTTLLAPTVGETQLHRAFTYESGDGLRAGEIHNPLMVQELVPQSVAAEPGAEVMQASLSGGEPARGTAVPGQRSEASAEDASPPPRKAATADQARMEVPSRSQLSDAASQVQRLYAERLKGAADGAQRERIVQEMLDAAEAMREDPAGAYSLQNAAAEVAVTIGNLELACRAIDCQVAMFQVSAVDQNAAMLAAAPRYLGLRSTTASGRAYVERALPVLYGLIDQNQYGLAEDICQAAVELESQTRDRMLLADLNRLRLQIKAARNQFHRTEAAIAELRDDASNASASATVGGYLAFFKGDWEQGLRLLAEGDNQRLARIATADLNTESSGSSAMATADAWWELGEATTQDSLRAACRGRAAWWYAKAIEALPESLARMHAESRIRDSQTSSVSSPLQAIERLAQHMGMDVHGALADLQNPVL